MTQHTNNHTDVYTSGGFIIHIGSEPGLEPLLGDSVTMLVIENDIATYVPLSLAAASEMATALLEAVSDCVRVAAIKRVADIALAGPQDD